MIVFRISIRKKMRYILWILVVFNLLQAVEFADKLPMESRQFLDSFECFTIEDKQMLYAYLLALKYRIDHVNKRDDLVKTELDYWRLWHIVSDIEYRCNLYYRFSNLLEDTLIQNDEEQKRLKKLRRVEGSIHVDGASESSARMSRYDEKLKQRILADPPKFIFLPKNKEKPDYDLTTLKSYPPKSIPKNIYDEIEKMKVTPLQRVLLLRYAYLKEELLRKYDQPKRRKEIKQELLYLGACQEKWNVYLRGEFYHNFKRKLANRVISTQDYGLKHEFLPKEVADYCEHNITKMRLGTFIPKIEKKKAAKSKHKEVKLKHLTDFLKRYENDAKKRKYAAEYLSLMKIQLQKSSVASPSVEALKLLRLKSCLVDGDDKEDFALIFARVKDFRIEGLKETFYSNIFNSQLWWKMTIKMKIDIEGETPALKHFFDCNQTGFALGKSLDPQANTPESSSGFTATDMRNGISHKDKILKYYAYLFENIPTPLLNNSKAIEHGIVAKKWVGKDGKIKTPFGKKVIIEGMPKGGIKLTYTGIPKGRLCTDFIQLNKNDVIFFNSKSYDGIEYILVNDNKIKLDHYVYKYAQKVCNKQENNRVSFVREVPVVKHAYRAKTLDSTFGKVKAIKELDRFNYDPYSAAYLQGVPTFIISATKAKAYDTRSFSVGEKLPDMLANSYYTALSPDGRYAAVGRYGTKIHIWSLQEHRRVKTFNDQKGMPFLFMPDSQTLLLKGKGTLYLFDIESGKTVATISPKFISKKRKYGGGKITAVTLSPDGEILYVGGDKYIIEKWRIEDAWGSSSVKVSYVGKIEDRRMKEIGALQFDPTNQDILVIASSRDKVKFFNVKSQKTVKTYTSDVQMGAKTIVFSPKYRYMMVVGGHGANLWKIGESEQLDIINGSRIVGGIFLEDPSKFILMAREVKVWQISE